MYELPLKNVDFNQVGIFKIKKLKVVKNFTYYF